MVDSLHYNGVEIRHEPDGELLAVLTSPTFNQSDVIEALRRIIKDSNNFSVRGIHTYESHVSFNNVIKIHRNKE